MQLSTTEKIQLKDLEIAVSRSFASWYRLKTPESKINYLAHVQEKANFMQRLTTKYEALAENCLTVEAIQDNEVIY